MTCGMPDPAAPGKKRTVHQTTPAQTSGVSMKGSHGQRWAQSLNCLSARSHKAVKATTLAPARPAKASTTMRAIHSCELARSPRIAASTSGWR